MGPGGTVDVLLLRLGSLQQRGAQHRSPTALVPVPWQGQGISRSRIPLPLAPKRLPCAPAPGKAASRWVSSPRLFSDALGGLLGASPCAGALGPGSFRQSKANVWRAPGLSPSPLHRPPGNHQTPHPEGPDVSQDPPPGGWGAECFPWTKRSGFNEQNRPRNICPPAPSSSLLMSAARLLSHPPVSVATAAMLGSGVMLGSAAVLPLPLPCLGSRGGRAPRR